MPKRQPVPAWVQRWPMLGAIALIGLCFALGGSSRADVVQPSILRPLALAWITVLLCFAPRIDWRVIRWPLGVLIALGAIMILQLMPLPFSLWTAFPGRELAREALIIAGEADRARPWSLMPDRTLNSLFALCVPIAITLTMGALTGLERRQLLPWLLGAVVANMLLVFLQLVTDVGRFRPFRTTDMEAAVGLFSNRNHSAVLIAAALPLVACLANSPGRNRHHRTPLWLMCGGGAVLALFAILAIGSRSGLIMAIVGVLWATFLLWPRIKKGFARRPRTARLAIILLPVLGVGALIALSVLGARDEAIRRLFNPELYADIRIQSLPTSLAMVGAYFPFGSGFGTFDAVYRIFEPRELLHLRYFNHAHNDFIELMIDAGLAGAIVLAVAVGWFAVTALRVLRGRGSIAEPDRNLALAAAGVLLIAALASITDYPLRTPIWMLVTAVCATWLANARSEPSPKSDGSSLR